MSDQVEASVTVKSGGTPLTTEGGTPLTQAPLAPVLGGGVSPALLSSVIGKALALAQQPGAGELLAEGKQGISIVAEASRQSGFKSSEFLGTMLIVLASIGWLALQAYRGQPLSVADTIPFLAGVLKAMTYTASRTSLKKTPTDPQQDPIPKPPAAS